MFSNRTQSLARRQFQDLEITHSGRVGLVVTVEVVVVLTRDLETGTFVLRQRYS
jgi:hypothetical protein